MAPEAGRLTRRVTFALLVLASGAAEIAAVDTRPVAESLGLAAVWVGLTLGLGWLVPPPKEQSGRPPRFVTAVLALLLVAPFAIEPLRRQWTGDGYPVELQMVFGLRNLGLGLAAFAAWPLCLRLAAVVSLFLMLFSVSMTEHQAVLMLLALYSATGSLWLMLVHWTGLRGFFAAAETAATVEVQAGRERLPWPAFVVVVGLVGSALAVGAVGPQRTARVLGEWLPTSGGTGGYDPFARGGLNDGDDEIKGRNARSTGMVESDTFLDSPLPSLYDMFTDLYGEPFKPKDQERAIALDAQTKVNESRKPPADNLRPNREFPTTRKAPRRPRDPSDRAARALFEVQGRTPLHVRLTAFDRFDGIAWQEAPPDLRTCQLDREPDSYWMRVAKPSPDPPFAQVEAHRFKIATGFGSVVPTPPHLRRFRMGRVDQPNFFAWGRDRILRLAARKLPSGVSVETEACPVDPRQLDTVGFPTGVNGTRTDYTRLPGGLNPGIADLAGRWTEGLPRGWPQIDAVVRRLREAYSLDPGSRVPDDCTEPLAYFLLEARRGPDYQFATAAAVQLRALGYSTRLVSGFYVSPDHFDPLTRHTPVVWDDLHFWAEVLLPGGDWLVLEPTPGYEILGPSQPWSERILSALAGVVYWAERHAGELLFGSLALAGLWWRRRELLDVLAVVAWRWAGSRSWDRCVRQAIGLLERRGRWVGHPRLPFQTVTHWLRSALPADPAEVAELVRMAEWASYGSDLPPPWKGAEVRSACRRTLDRWTLKRWQRAGRPILVGGSGQ